MSRSTDRLIHYFVRKGYAFSQFGTGFTAEDPTSIYYHANGGSIISTGTTIRMQGDNMDALQFDPPIEILQSDRKTLQAIVPEGTIRFWR